MFAIFCVVITHVTEIVYGLNLETLMQYTVDQRIFAIAMFTIGRLGVPIFFFLTGYLLLDREYSGERYKTFLEKNFCGLFLTTAIWIVIYTIFGTIFWETPFNIAKCLMNIAFFRSMEIGHMWYMPVIMGMYLFIPFVANALKTTDIRIFCVPLSFVAFFEFVVPVANVWLTAMGQGNILTLLDLSFSGNEYGFMILLGYMVKIGMFDPIPSAAFAVLGTIAYLFTVVTQNYSDVHGFLYNVWYNSGSLVLADLAIFVLLSRINPKSGKLASRISVASFGIYMIHKLILLPLDRYYQSDMSRECRFAVMVIITFSVSWLMVVIIGKVKPLAHVLFHIKHNRIQPPGTGKFS